MVYAEIMVKISVDESKLTSEQQEQAAKADTDIRIDYPLDKGVSNLKNIIEVIGLSKFEYLGDGRSAVEIEVE